MVCFLIFEYWEGTVTAVTAPHGAGSCLYGAVCAPCCPSTRPHWGLSAGAVPQAGEQGEKAKSSDCIGDSGASPYGGDKEGGGGEPRTDSVLFLLKPDCSHRAEMGTQQRLLSLGALQQQQWGEARSWGEV